VLEERGLVERQPCPADARAINAQLTASGLELARAAQSTHLAAVRERFFDRLSAPEIANAPPRSFLRLLARRRASACTADG